MKEEWMVENLCQPVPDFSLELKALARNLPSD